MRLPDRFIQELIERNDIESVVSSYIQLKRRGRYSVGLCPFHGEKTPSFTLYPDTSSFYCFGCGAAGDVITFIRRIENLDYLDAVKFLADRCGMQMPERDVDDRAARLRTRILEANRDAARLYHSFLYSSGGKIGLDYYRSRGYTDATIRHFGLGYAPQSFHFLRDELRKKGYHDEELTAAFLTKQSKGSVYDVFRNRVMIPIIDIRGNVIAFGGRVLDDSKPKYINTSDTLAFKKTNNLFALNFAKSSADSLILCEGYMDVIALHQAGFTNAVAALGTSFTADHANLIARYTKEVILIFDSDAAGRKAADKAIGLLRNTDVNIRVVRIPDGKDPDEFIKKNGAERFKLLLERSANDIEYQLMDIGSKHALSTADGQVSYLREACAALAKLSSPIERDVYAGKLAKQLNASKSAVLMQIQHEAKRQQKKTGERELSQVIRQERSAARKITPEAEQYPRAFNAEQALIGMVIRHPDLIGTALEQIDPEDLMTALHRRIYGLIKERHASGLLIELSFLTADLEDDEMAYLTRTVQSAKEFAATKEEVARFAQIIRQERMMARAKTPDELSVDDMQALMKTLKEQKK